MVSKERLTNWRKNFGISTKIYILCVNIRKTGVIFEVLAQILI
jgi:hypothetical protein